MVCPWIFVSSPQAITIFVSIFGAALGPMFGIMVADYYLVKRQQIVLKDLYTMSPEGSLYFESGWNRMALIALAGSGFVSIGLSLLGAYGVITNIGDWGWLIGAALGALLYIALMRRREVRGADLHSRPPSREFVKRMQNPRLHENYICQ